MTASDDSPRNEGRQGGGPIRGRNRGRNRGRGRPDHGFTRRGESPTRTWVTNPYKISRGGRGRGSPGFNQNRSPRDVRGSNDDETFIPKNLFDELYPTHRSIFLRGRNAYNTHDGCMQHNQQPHDHPIGSVLHNILMMFI
jgi:hypothetical protein